MQTPFERLAAVLDNASANYLSEQQRQQQLADQRQYAAQHLADQRQYAAQQLAEQRQYDAQQLAEQRQYDAQQLAERRQYDEGLTNKNRAYEQEAALVKAGYLSKPVGKNTPEDIAAGAALAAQHALALRTDENDARTDTAAQRAHAAAQRKREEEGWALNPLKSDKRKAMEAAVDGGMIDFGKPAAQMTDEEIEQAYTKTRADSIARANAGDDYANRLQAEFLKADAAADPTPTVAEINRARAVFLLPSSPSSRADLQMAEQAAQQMAAQIAAQRAAFAMRARDEVADRLSDVIKKGHYPTAPAALGVPTPAPAALGAPVSTEQALGDFFGDIDAQSTTMGKAPAALGLDEEVARGRITEEVDKAWPEIESDYTLASLGDDAIRERINKKVMRTQVSSAPLSPETSYFVDPSKAEIASRLIALRDKQKAARGRLAKRRSQFEQYVPKTADAEQMRRAQIAKAILGLTKTEEAIKKNAFESTAATLAQQ